MQKRSALAILPLLASCAAAGGAPAGDPNTQVTASEDGFHVSMPVTQRTVAAEIDAPVAEVWAVLPGVMAEAGLAGTADAPTRTVSTQPRMVRGRLLDQPLNRLLDCGRGEFGVEYAASSPVRLGVRTTVQPGADGGSRLETVVEAQVRSSSGANAVLAPCRTLGRIEEGIAERVRARLAG